MTRVYWWNSTLLLAAIALQTPAHAHSFKPIKKATAPQTEKIRAAIAEASASLTARIGDFGGGAPYEAYKVTKISPARGDEETDVEVFQRIIEASLHRDYPITGDEDGYSLARYTDPKDFERAVPDGFSDHADDDEAMEKCVAMVKLLKASLKNKNLFVYMGTGSGNNTFADIIAVYDKKNNEFIYFVRSNFGSDN